MGKFVDITGRQFGRLTVLERAAVDTLKPHWHCRCDCGRHCIVGGSDLKLGKTTSCGCAKLDGLLQRNYRHGHAKRGHLPSEYHVWSNMKRRCTDPASEYFHLYGGRGIRVCDRWMESFAAFYDDMGPRPKWRTLDRIDSDGDYTPENCHWATARQQANNKRNNRRVEYDGRMMTVAEIADDAQVGYMALLRRVKDRGQTADEAIAAIRAHPRPKRRR